MKRLKIATMSAVGEISFPSDIICLEVDSYQLGQAAVEMLHNLINRPGQHGLTTQILPSIKNLKDK